MNKSGGRKLCALCKTRRTRARGAALARDLQAALLTCCHLWVPAPADPICDQCKSFYRAHLRGHAESTAYRPNPNV